MATRSFREDASTIALALGSVSTVVLACAAIGWLWATGKSLETVAGAAIASLTGIGAYLLQSRHDRWLRACSVEAAVLVELRTLDHVLGSHRAAEFYGDDAPAPDSDRMAEIRRWDSEKSRRTGRSPGFASMDDEQLRLALRAKTDSPAIAHLVLPAIRGALDDPPDGWQPSKMDRLATLFWEVESLNTARAGLVAIEAGRMNARGSRSSDLFFSGRQVVRSYLHHAGHVQFMVRGLLHDFGHHEVA